MKRKQLEKRCRVLEGKLWDSVMLGAALAQRAAELADTSVTEEINLALGLTDGAAEFVDALDVDVLPPAPPPGYNDGTRPMRGYADGDVYVGLDVPPERGTGMG